MPLTGFFLYALEIMEGRSETPVAKGIGKDVEVLKTNLQPFFWDLRSNS